MADTEIRLLQALDGQPGFVRCFGTTCRPGQGSAREYWMLLEYCSNGSLIDLIYEKDKHGQYQRGAPLAQERVLEIFEGLAASTAHMHSLDPPVAHRDLKLENVLCREDGTFVLCDFGSATTSTLPAGQRSRRDAAAEEERISKYSTQMYRAPEMVDLHLGYEVADKVDVWALGCILYSMCFGDHPFAAESTLQILNGGYVIPTGSPYSDSIHDLIRSMLTRDPAERPRAVEMLERVRTLRRRGRRSPLPATASASPSAPAHIPAKGARVEQLVVPTDGASRERQQEQALPPTPVTGACAEAPGAPVHTWPDSPPEPRVTAAASQSSVQGQPASSLRMPSVTRSFRLADWERTVGELLAEHRALQARGDAMFQRRTVHEPQTTRTS